MKPPTENASEYSKTKAPEVLRTLSIILIQNLLLSLITTLITKSSLLFRKNKIELEEIEEIMKQKGKNRKLYEVPCFTSGKTSFTDHKEFLFIQVRYFEGL